jgi:putative redox protein
VIVTTEIVYRGELHCTARHGPSGGTIETDAPVDNEGRGEAFSPTDLVAAAIGTCMVTIMGIAARRHGIRIEGTRVTVEKEMIADPLRRIRSLSTVIEVPVAVTEEERRLLVRAAESCPVRRSLHPNVELPLRFVWRS